MQSSAVIRLVVTPNITVFPLSFSAFKHKRIAHIYSDEFHSICLFSFGAEFRKISPLFVTLVTLEYKNRPGRSSKCRFTLCTSRASHENHLSVLVSMLSRAWRRSVKGVGRNPENNNNSNNIDKQKRFLFSPYRFECSNGPRRVR